MAGSRADQFRRLAQRLDVHHELFRAVWEIGEPEFTESVETAAIVFSQDGAPIRFLFNAAFWDELPEYDREFVVCHEMLHVVLNHGLRSLDLMLAKYANVAADLAVNHLLVARFGFVRELLRDADALCWVDTVFPLARRPDPCLAMEDYYSLLCATNGADLRTLVDEHCFQRGGLNQRGVAAEVDRLLGGLDPAIRADAADRLGREGRMPAPPGIVPLGSWLAVKPETPEDVKWEEVIRRRLMRRPADVDTSGWVHPDRRFLEVGLELPGKAPSMTPSRLAGRQRCTFFLDASGSTWELQDRFFSLARSLPERDFDVELCSFDCRVYPLDRKRPVVLGGGGTSFEILERHLCRKPAKGKPPRYPDVVIVLTDGLGDHVRPLHPERWHWLLTSDCREFVPSGSVRVRIR